MANIKNLGSLETSEDFISFYFDQLQQRLNSSNINVSKAGFIGFTLSLLGNLQFDIKGYYDNLFNEAFPVTAIDNENIVYHSNLFGFIPGFANSSKLNGNIRFDFNQIPTISTAVDRREIILNDVTFKTDDIPFTLESSYKIIITRSSPSTFGYSVEITDINNNQTNIPFLLANPVIKIDGANQFEKQTITFTTPNYVFGSHYSETFDLDSSFLSKIIPTIDSETFNVEQTKSFISSSSNTIFLKFLSDTEILIEVGSGIHGKYIPNTVVSLDLFKTKGVKGNIAAQNIRNAVGSLTIFDFDSSDVLLNSTTLTDVSKFLTFEVVNGENGIDILRGDKLRDKLIEFIQSRTNLISETDFENILSKFFTQFQLIFKKTTLVENIILLYNSLKDINAVPVYTRTTSVLKTAFDRKLLNPEFTIDGKTFLSPFLYKFDSFLNLYKGNIIKKDPVFFPFESNNILVNDGSNAIPIFIQLVYDGKDTVISIKSFQDITIFTAKISIPLQTVSLSNTILDSANDLFTFTLSNINISEKSTINIIFNNGTADIYEYKFRDIQQVLPIDDIISLKQYDKDTFGIDLAIFTGAGLDDATSGGTFSTNVITNYRAVIDGVVNKSITAFAVLSSGTIANFTDSSITPLIHTTITSNSHGLLNGDSVSITGTVNYNGIFIIQDITANTFDIISPFIFDEQVGSWQKSPTKTTVTSAAHGLSNGNTIVISTTTNYNGTFIIEGSTANTFDIIRNFISDDAVGSWEKSNTFKWSDDGGSTFIATGVIIDKTNQLLNNGVTIKFANITGHLLTTVTSAVLSGTGLDDISSGGLYTGTSIVTYRVEIDSIGGTDTFRWSKDGGLNYILSNIAMTGSAQTLENGVTVIFTATTGHTLNDLWIFVANPSDRWDFTASNEFIVNLPLIDKTTFFTDELFYSNLLVDTLGTVGIPENRMISDEVQARFLNSHFIKSSITSGITTQTHNLDITLPLKLVITLLLNKSIITKNKLNVNNEIDKLKDKIADFVFSLHTGNDISFFRTALVDLIMNENYVTSTTIRVIDSLNTIINSSTFTGDGLNDLTSGGTFTGLDVTNYHIEIDTVGTPDRFKWSDDGGVTFDASKIAISGNTQFLNNGVTIDFGNAIGHNTRIIGPVNFTGSGLNNATSSGTFTGTTTTKYRVEIDTISAPDTFRWSRDDGKTFQASAIAITGSSQLLENGVNISFNATTGHSLSSVGTKVFTGGGLDDATSGGTFNRPELLNYRVEVDSVGGTDTFRWSDSNGSIYNASAVVITGASQSLNNGVTVTFGAITGHSLAAIDVVIFTGSGLNDAASGGIFTSKSIINYRVEVDSVKTGVITAFAPVATGSITVFADSAINPGTATTVTAPSHGLINGNLVDITGTTNYNSTFTIQDATINTFDIVTAFVGNDATGIWTKDGTKTLVSSTAHQLLNGSVINITGTTNYNGIFTIEQVLTNSFVIVDTFVADDATGAWEDSNTFKWSNTGGTSFNAINILMDTTAQVLDNGTTITFTSRFGHTLTDRWDFTANPPDRWDFTANPPDRWDFTANPPNFWTFSAIPSNEIPNGNIKSVDQNEFVTTLQKTDLINFSPIFWYWDLNNINITFTVA